MIFSRSTWTTSSYTACSYDLTRCTLGERNASRNRACAGYSSFSGAAALPGIRNEISTDTSFRRPGPARILRGGSIKRERERWGERKGERRPTRPVDKTSAFLSSLDARRSLLTRRVKSGNRRRESIWSFTLQRLKKFPIISTRGGAIAACSRQNAEREREKRAETEGNRELEIISGNTFRTE